MKISNMFGEFSGRLGNMVFSRNRGGAYVKNYVSPVQPNTERQRAARIKFGNASAGYAQLMAQQKAQWNAYADTQFLPLVGTGRGSGINAYTSLNYTISQINEVMALTQINPSITQEEIPAIYTPPNKNINGELYYDDNVKIPFQFSYTQFSNNSHYLEIAFDYEFPENTIIRTSAGTPAILLVYRSEYLSGEYKVGAYSRLIAATPLLKNLNENHEILTIASRPDTKPLQCYVRFTLVVADQYGQQAVAAIYDKKFN